MWQMPLDGGEETEAVRGSAGIDAWALGRSGIYFATMEPLCWARTQKYTIRYRDCESVQVTELFRKEGSFDHVVGGLSRRRVGPLRGGPLQNLRADAGGELPLSHSPVVSLLLPRCYHSIRSERVSGGLVLVLIPSLTPT